MYRLHIDIPLDHDLETAKRIGVDVIQDLLRGRAESVVKLSILPEPPTITYKVDQINYRLGNDEDRQKSNYYIMDSNGHVTHKKCVHTFSNDVVPQPRMDWF